MTKKIAQGAEAILRKDGDCLIKERIPKSYRHPTIDEEIRADRTKQEARLLQKAEQAGVQTPAVEITGDYTLSIEWIEGQPLRDRLDTLQSRWAVIGTSIGRLHANDIIHGDLTTSNILVTPDDDLVFIDFGLGFFSQRTEDRATDLRLLRQTLEATHNEIWEDVFSSVIDAYHEQYEDSNAVEDQLASIHERQRYT